jgi:hypothetical protein
LVWPAVPLLSLPALPGLVEAPALLPLGAPAVLLSAGDPAELAPAVLLLLPPSDWSPPSELLLPPHAASAITPMSEKPSFESMKAMFSSARAELSLPAAQHAQGGLGTDAYALTRTYPHCEQAPPAPVRALFGPTLDFSVANGPQHVASTAVGRQMATVVRLMRSFHR